MALKYTIETSSKFSLFYDDPIDQTADADELFARVKKEKEEERLAKEKAKKEEKEKLKKDKQKVEQVTPASQPTASLIASDESKNDNAPVSKPQRVPGPRASDANRYKPSNQQPVDVIEQGDVTVDRNTEQHNRPRERVFRGFSVRGNRGRGGPRRDDFQSESANVLPQGNSNENFDGRPQRGFRGRGRPRGFRFNTRPPYSRPSGSPYNGKFTDRPHDESTNNWNQEETSHHEQPTSVDSAPPFEPDHTAELEPVEPNAIQVEESPIVDAENATSPSQQESKVSDLPEVQELTIAEYFASKDSERQRLESMQHASLKKGRKKLHVPEKVGDFDGMVPYIKKNWDEEETEEEEDAEATDEQKRKHTLEIPFVRSGPRPTNFPRGESRPPRTFRGSRGRIGGFRGARRPGPPGEYVRGRGYGGVAKSHRQEAVHLRLDSDLDFPSLGAE